MQDATYIVVATQPGGMDKVVSEPQGLDVAEVIRDIYAEDMQYTSVRVEQHDLSSTELARFLSFLSCVEECKEQDANKAVFANGKTIQLHKREESTTMQRLALIGLGLLVAALATLMFTAPAHAEDMDGVDKCGMADEAQYAAQHVRDNPADLEMLVGAGWRYDSVDHGLYRPGCSHRNADSACNPILANSILTRMNDYVRSDAVAQDRIAPVCNGWKLAEDGTYVHYGVPAEDIADLVNSMPIDQRVDFGSRGFLPEAPTGYHYTSGWVLTPDVAVSTTGAVSGTDTPERSAPAVTEQPQASEVVSSVPATTPPPTPPTAVKATPAPKSTPAAATPKTTTSNSTRYTQRSNGSSVSQTTSVKAPTGTTSHTVTNSTTQTKTGPSQSTTYTTRQSA